MESITVKILKCRECGFFGLSDEFDFDDGELVYVCPGCGAVEPEEKKREVAYAIRVRGELNNE